MNSIRRMTEEEVKLNFVTPNILSKWEIEKVRMEYRFTAGRIVVEGNKTYRKKNKSADYLLFYKDNLPLAVIEAKDNSHTIRSGLQQALDYARILDIPFAYSTNGSGFIEVDLIKGTERELNLTEFPTANELWSRYKSNKSISYEQENIILSPYYFESGGKIPRYYQTNAINRSISGISNGDKRQMIVLATGTGKTFVAQQIIWRLIKSRKIKKVLYIADRNILIDQTINNDFRPFKNIMTKIEGHNVSPEYQVYLSLYHQLTDSYADYYKQFEKDFFDLVIIDECHRGSAKEDSSWREILDYFNNAIHIGLTATPKETESVSNKNYFGDPIFVYSLKQGIEDGFLAPYKVIRVNLDIDTFGWRPKKGMKDKDGNLIEDRLYIQNDFDKTVVVDERTQVVAKRITEYLTENGRFSKTIIFCVDIAHAERMVGALINENSDLFSENSKYIVQITSGSPEGKAQLENFIDPYEKYPVIAVTSRLMSTGVDAQTCQLIVFEKAVNSMIEFKQIIGRGTRVVENDYVRKMYFTIMDFRNNYSKFADPSFDGLPDYVFEGKEPKEPISEPKTLEPNIDTVDVDETSQKIIHVNGISVRVIDERVEYLDENGALITISLLEYSRQNLLKYYPQFSDFHREWMSTPKRQNLIYSLVENGIFVNYVKESLDMDVDEYDIITFIGYDEEPLLKQERVIKVQLSDWISQFPEQNRMVISNLLDIYRKKNSDEFKNLEILALPQFREIATPQKIVRDFGGKENYQEVINHVDEIIYSGEK